ncbi:hypothetical protein F2Q69_00003229 [Brassica cretica]|uniref:Replication factor A C-terminal domain-containing protein n=1 Tax=Brassica cretica TaxID=69181 RepID=A0A8S9NZ26_BRACR|nr:hypothetical protein F2Q69_00003229 [Brassica cretica]
MVISRVFFSDLKSGKCSSVVEAWLLRFWEARNVKRGGELMCVDMLHMDVNRLAARTIYSVSGFDVARCAQNSKLADSSLMIRFSDSTEFDVLADPISPLPAEGFRFRNQTELVGLANTNTQLPGTDVILHGEIKVVKNTVSGPPEDKNRVMVTVKLENDVSVTLSLFDAQAILFHQKLEGMCGDPKVIVATSINPKMVVYSLCVYYDKEINAGESFFYRLVAAEPLLRSYAKEIDFLCTGRVSRVEADKGWCYVACSKCSKKLQHTATSYHVEMVITDDTAEGTFVCFDGVMTKLHNLRASEAVQLLAEERVNPEDFVMPPYVAEMEGKTYTFQVRVTSYNFTVNHQTFTVSHIINEGGDDDDDDDAPDGTTSREKSASGKGGCETSKSAGKEPVGNVRKRARVD